MFKSRIAPTPSGYLHLGNVFNVMLTWLWTRSNNGQLLLRIDDADQARVRSQYVTDIFEVFDWLGVDWDLGPTGPSSLNNEWSQHHRQAHYTALLHEWIETNQVYACTCSRSNRSLTKAQPTCSCAGRLIPLDQPGVSWWIQTIPNHITTIHDALQGMKTATPSTFMIRQRDGQAAYQVMSLSDDRQYGINRIVRGQDLLESSFRQVYLDGLLKKPFLQKALFWHHSLLLDPQGQKQSKSAGVQARSLKEIYTKTTIEQLFYAWLGLNMPQPDSWKSLVGDSFFTR
jgi:glutamyl/glutaminyl-tRNA synthetase